MNWGEWNPKEEVLNSIRSVLQDALVPNSEVQRNVQENLSVIENYPDYTNYLLLIFGNSDLFPDEVRSISGIILKNNILSTYDRLSQQMLENVREKSLQLLKDTSKNVRSSACNLIITIVYKTGVWPQLVPFLKGLLDSSDEQLNETALSLLFKICDEYLVKQGHIMSNDLSTTLALVTPKFISLLINSNSNIRKDIMKLLNQAMQCNYVAIREVIDIKAYFNNLLQMCDDEDVDIQKYICQAFVIFAESGDDVIVSHLPSVINYVMIKTKHEDGDVALQACEFWLATAKLPNCCDILHPYLESLLPILLENMRYSNYELNALRDSMGNDANIQDNANDIRPVKIHSACDDQDDDYYYDDENNYDGSDAIDEPYIGWTLRKCSAASLDALAVKFKGDILPVLYPLLNNILLHPNFIIKESAVLALGAIADGCMNNLDQHLPAIVDYLNSLMKDNESIIRVITCWTLSRYISWIVNANESPEVYFLPVMTELLKHFTDDNKRVQRAAISAFCVFQEEARIKLVPYINFILQGFVSSFEKMQFRSFLLLYDAIGVFAQSVGNNLNKEEYVSVLMTPLIKKLIEFDTYQDDQFLALLECIADVIPSLEVGFLPYAEMLFSRCLQIINDILMANNNYNEKPDEFDPPDKEPLIVAHDMLLSMAIGLKMYFVKFFTNSNLIYVLHVTMQDETERVRQPAIALFGELVKLCFPFISPNISEYIPIIIQNIDKRYDGACNNAAWVIGRLCAAMGNTIEPYVPTILESFVQILETPVVTRTMYQTVAISFCTLGLVCSDTLAPILNSILRPCCLAMRNVRDCEEKDMGFRGLCELIVRNPTALNNDFVYFCDAVASWNDIRPDLKATIRNILVSFKSQLRDDNWLYYYNQFPPQLQSRLQDLYGV